MAPYEALYECKFRSYIGWFKVCESQLIEQDLIQQEVDKVGDWGLLKVSLMKGVKMFRTKGNISPSYIGPYQIIRRVDRVAYELDLTAYIQEVHLVFHVSMLRKCLGDPSRVVPVDDVQITEHLTYEEVLVAILDLQVRRLRTKDIPLVKVLWRSNNVEEMT
ncbi:uncharacterized protein LOC142173449 [Nicotiana tabacum]|uniref:Uncharacterized protein LOC142173449 n=1 Tax=Nicotiana tabacum TaxID=4097 RepID=A0AC58TD35_TOBAC